MELRLQASRPISYHAFRVQFVTRRSPSGSLDNSDFGAPSSPTHTNRIRPRPECHCLCDGYSTRVARCRRTSSASRMIVILPRQLSCNSFCVCVSDCRDFAFLPSLISTRWFRPNAPTTISTNPGSRDVSATLQPACRYKRTISRWFSSVRRAFTRTRQFRSSPARYPPGHISSKHNATALQSCRRRAARNRPGTSRKTKCFSVPSASRRSRS